MRDHRDLPAFQTTHELLLFVYEATHRLPTAGEPGSLAVRLRATTLSAAGALVRGSALSGRRFAGELEHAACRLRETGYYIDLAQSLGYLTLEAALELLEKQARARFEVASLLQALVEEEVAGAAHLGHLALGSARLAAAEVPAQV
jgi:biotin operon repressor